MTPCTFLLIPAGPDLRALVNQATGEVRQIQDREGRPFDPLTFDPFIAQRAAALAHMAWASTADE